MNTEKAIEVLQSHKSHWERLLRDKICDKTEGTDFINAVDMAIKTLRENEKLKAQVKKWKSKAEEIIRLWNEESEEEE